MLRWFTTALSLLGLCAPMTMGAPLKKGDKAPDFTMTGSDGKEYSLKDFVGKKDVVIAWYPKAFTGG